MNLKKLVNDITTLQSKLITKWKKEGICVAQTDLDRRFVHAQNYLIPGESQNPTSERDLLAPRPISREFVAQNNVQDSQTHFFKLVEENFMFNYQLWHAEDRARRDDMGYEFVYHAKREIDAHNQQRNNRMEAIDTWLCNTLKPTTSSECPVHSETPGMMIDRLAILTLKSYHMMQQANRTNAADIHRENCLKKLQVLTAQQKQLTHCLDALLQETHNKTRTFQVYHQFKMYNDPTLNPELYGTRS